MPVAPLDITLPLPDSTTARRALGQYLKYTARLLTQIPMGRFQAPVFDAFADARAQLTALLRGESAGLAYRCLRRPSVSVLIRCLHRELWGDGDVRRLDALLGELTALIWFELAVAHQLPTGGVKLTLPRPRLAVACLEVELSLHPDARLGLRDGQLVVELGEQAHLIELEQLAAIGAGAENPHAAPAEGAVALSVRRTHFPICGEIHLVTTDNNPLALEEAHPDKQGNALDLGGREPEAWQAAVAEAYALIDAHYPELAAEMQLVMHAYHPVGYDAERHLSASYAEAVGTAYLSLHPDVMTLAEALIHEFSHNKLNALIATSPILNNGYGQLVTSPVRPDPRPLHGVLLAVHAFVPVAELYRRLKQAQAPVATTPDFERRYQAIIQKDLDGIQTLREHAEPTELGERCLAELYAWAAEHAPAA
ncbi:MAG: hypothetical protein KIT72_16045 [Polyangiaceae bacterium]|nr:hypothetical protein [Polyangiaceae bacterium]MCW5791929.1 hypothetical protein [Polyangiaceae bacterium]